MTPMRAGFAFFALFAVSLLVTESAGAQAPVAPDGWATDVPTLSSLLAFLLLLTFFFCSDPLPARSSINSSSFGRRTTLSFSCESRSSSLNSRMRLARFMATRM